MDWLDLLAVQGTLKSLLQHYIFFLQKSERTYKKWIVYTDYAKAFDCVDHNKLWKILKWEYQTTWPASWETCMQVRKQQLELDTKQQTGSK